MGEIDWKGWAQIVAVVMSIIALLVSIRTQRKSFQFLHYGELDKVYFEILKIGIDRPYLRDPALISNDQERRGYDAYAYIVWNFVETIYDRCLKHRHLMETWSPVVKAEHKLHQAWFEAAENAPKFKVPFRKWIAELSRNS